MSLALFLFIIALLLGIAGFFARIFLFFAIVVALIAIFS